MSIKRVWPHCTVGIVSAMALKQQTCPLKTNPRPAPPAPAKAVKSSKKMWLSRLQRAKEMVSSVSIIIMQGPLELHMHTNASAEQLRI